MCIALYLLTCQTLTIWHGHLEKQSLFDRLMCIFHFKRAKAHIKPTNVFSLFNRLVCMFLFHESLSKHQTHQCFCFRLYVNEGIFDSGQGILDHFCFFVLHLIAERQVQQTPNWRSNCFSVSNELIINNASNQLNKHCTTWFGPG